MLNRLLKATVALPLVAVLASCSSGPGHSAASAAGTWSLPGLDAVSRPVIGDGVVAVTGLTGGVLRTVVADVASGRKLWEHPAAMAGRPTSLGVQPPAVAGQSVLAVERSGKRALLVARDARTGAQRWARPVNSTFGPAACGPDVCLSENTAGHGAAFAALDPATGRRLWRTPGVAEVEWSDATRAVVFRMAAHPVVQLRNLATGKAIWSYSVERAVGRGANLSGGWSFSSTGGTLVGYIGPYQQKAGGPLSAYGFFGLRLDGGTLAWSRRRMLRVYPSAAPAVALITRLVTSGNDYGGFARLDPGTGATRSELPESVAPTGAWWLAFPADLSSVGFLVRGRQGTAYGFGNRSRLATRSLRSWSFCTLAPPPLKITGEPGFYPIVPLCAYDLDTGRQVTDAGPPPSWYTGATDGWRVWRDDRGTLYGVRDVQGSLPGMYG